MDNGEEVTLPNGMKNRDPDYNEFSVTDWAATPIKEFDLNDIYFEKVHPLMEQVHDLCRDLGIPFLWYCVPRQDCEGRQVESCSWMGGPAVPTPELLALQIVVYENDHIFEKIAAIGAAYDMKMAVSKH